MTPSASDLLAHHAPTTSLDEPDTTSLDAVLHRVLDEAPTRRGPSRRLVLTAAAVAAAALSVLTLPAVLESDGADVAALEQLAVTAGERPAQVVTPGTFLHMTTIENPSGVPSTTALNGGPDIYPRTLETWTAADGTTWRHDTEVGGRQYWDRFPPTPAIDAAPDVTPRTLTGLPHDEEALLAFLRPRVTGSSSTDEAVFVYLNDALRAGYAPPEVQRALIGAMARLPHIDVERTRSRTGVPCLSVSYTDPSRNYAQFVCFDEGTATMVEEGNRNEDGTLGFLSVVSGRDIVDAVPPEVLREVAAAEVRAAQVEPGDN